MPSVVARLGIYYVSIVDIGIVRRECNAQIRRDNGLCRIIRTGFFKRCLRGGDVFRVKTITASRDSVTI